MNQFLILIRGIPGSGKSTLANFFDDTFVKLEADMYFVDKDGVYRYDGARIKDAHAWCQNQTRDALGEGYSVAVSNTFTQQWELQPYIDMARERGLIPLIVHCQNDFGSVHAVPEAAMQKFRDRWQQHIYI